MSDIDKGKLLVLATAISSGIAVFYNAYAVQNADPLVFTALKNTLTALMLVALAAFAGQWKEFVALKAGQWMRLLAIAVIGGSIPFALFFWGLSQTDPSSGSFIYRFLFFASAALAAWALKERPSRNTLLGVM
ncbi:MAG: DMT family transporter, partial [Candidatus Micrarchaeota archaeon]|nr:DMT family transporter [Candidatus Micrarchaeota archaeon]